MTESTLPILKIGRFAASKTRAKIMSSRRRRRRRRRRRITI
jgi:hypothetical protein